MSELTSLPIALNKVSKNFGNNVFAFELKTILEKVFWILGSKDDVRNNDMKLVKEYYLKFHGECIGDGMVGPYISLDALVKGLVPPPETIIRLRRKINELGFLLPTIEKVAVMRRLNINKWREALGYEDSDQGKLAI